MSDLPEWFEWEWHVYVDPEQTGLGSALVAQSPGGWLGGKIKQLKG